MFDPVPLEERLLANVEEMGQFYNLILRQKGLARQIAKNYDQSLPMPPEVRLGTITANRRVMIDFTNPMNLPPLTVFVEQNEQLNNELLNVMMLSGETDEIDENLTSWKIVQVE